MSTNRRGQLHAATEVRCSIIGWSVGVDGGRGRLERKKGKMNGRDDRKVTLEVTARRRAII